MKSMNDTTTGKDLFNCLMSSLNRTSFGLSKLESITTDGAPHSRKTRGLVCLMKLEIQKNFLHAI